MATWSWPVTLVVVLAVATPAMVLLGWVYERPGTNLWLLWGALAVLTAGISTVLFAVRRRRLRAEGRWEASLEATEAFYAGRVPADPVIRGELIRLVATVRPLLPFYRWGAPVIFGGQALLQVVSAQERPRVWVAVVLFAGAALVMPFYHRRIRHQLAVIEAGLVR